MSVPDRTDWPDARLNELAGRVRDAASKAEMENLRRDFKERFDGVDKNVNGLRGEVRKIVGEPIIEGRAKRNAIAVSLVSILMGTGISSLIYFLSGASPH